MRLDLDSGKALVMPSFLLPYFFNTWEHTVHIAALMRFLEIHVKRAVLYVESRSTSNTLSDQ